MKSDDLNLLVSLDALLQERSVSKAARRLGLSTPAMSHALARARERLGDPVLVRAGRGMVLTPRAEAMRSSVHAAVTQAREALAPARPFVPHELERTFVVFASDYVLAILGGTIDRILRTEAPRASVRFVPNGIDDAEGLRDGAADLAVGIYGALPQEMRSRQLLTDRFVCVVRAGHPEVGRTMSLAKFLALPHVQVAPRGTPGGYIDDVLRTKGLSRSVVRAIPYFLGALQLTAETDYVLTVSERLSRRVAPSLGLRLLEVPFDLRPYALSLVWHPRVDADDGHRFFRDVFVRAADLVARERHPSPRTRLDATDPASGQSRRRPRRR